MDGIGFKMSNINNLTFTMIGVSDRIDFTHCAVEARE